MKKVIGILMLSFISLYADSNSTLADAFTNGSVKGNLMLFNYHIDNENAPDAYATALGGYLKYTTQKNPLFASLRFYTSSPVGADKNRDQTKLFKDDNSSLTALAESFIGYRYKKRVFKAGNMMLETPMMNDDTTRIVPWSYQGFAFTSEALLDTRIQLNYINQIRSLTSDDYLKESASGEFDKGITMLALSYFGIPQLTISAHYYHAPKLYSTFIAQAKYKHTTDNDYLFCWGAQYFQSGKGGEYNDRENNNGGDDINLLAFKFGVDGPFWNSTLNYSQNFGLSGILKGYGGLSKVYTSGMMANGRGNYKPETWLLKSHIDLNDLTGKESEFAIWLTHTRVKDSRGKDFHSFYSHFRHHFTHEASIYIRFEDIHYKNKNDVNYLRIIMAYDF